MSVVISTAVSASPELLVSATMWSKKGTVETKAPNTQAWKTAQDGDELATGASVRAKDGSCTLEWAGGNTIVITPSSELRLDLMRIKPDSGKETTYLHLFAGKIYAKTKIFHTDDTEFVVTAPEAQSEFQGGRVSVETRDGATEIQTLDDGALVHITGGSTIILRDGWKILARGHAQTPAPARMHKGDTENFMALEGIGNPDMEIYEPDNDSTATSDTLHIAGRVGPEIAVAIGGITAQVDENGFFEADAPLKPGANAIDVQAKNRFGLSTNMTMNVNHQAYRSAVENTAPQPAARPRVSINLPAYLPLGGTISPAAAAAAGSSYETSPLSAGGASISSSGAKTGPQQSRLYLAVDTTPPPLTVIQPYNLFESGKGSCTGPDDTLTCTVIGRSEPGDTVTINDRAVKLQPDGTFNTTVSLSPLESAITVRARDSAGNSSTSIIQRAFSPSKAVYLTVAVNPSSITANNTDTATVTVNARNLIGGPVTGTSVSLSATFGGAILSNPIILNNGAATAVFRAGVGGVRNTVTITARSGNVSASTTLLLLPDIPPDLGN